MSVPVGGSAASVRVVSSQMTLSHALSKYEASNAGSDMAVASKRPTAFVEQVCAPSDVRTMPHGAPCVLAPQTSQPWGERPCPLFSAAS